MHWNNNVTDILEKQKANKKSYNNENSKYKDGYTRNYQNYNSKNNSKSYYNTHQEIPDDPYQQYSNHKVPSYNQPKNPYDNRNSTHKTSVYQKTPSSYQNSQQYESTVNQYNNFWDTKFNNYSEQEKSYLQSPPPYRPVSPSLYPSVSPSPSPYPSVSPSPVPSPKKQSNFEKHKKMYIIVLFILLLLIFL